MAERIKFTVWRDRWLRGAGDGKLLNEEGRRCCLGFLGQTCGVPDEAQLGIGLLSEVRSAHLPQWPSSLQSIEENESDDEFDEYDEPRIIESITESTLCNDIIGANDSETMSPESREATLAVLFLRAGIDVEFRDGSGPE